MPKLRCRCGYVHDLSPIPDAGYIAVRDSEYEELLDAEAKRSALGAASPPPPVEAFGAIDRRLKDLCSRLYDCPECGRLLWRRPGEEDYASYAREPPAGQQDASGS